jgi:hypothetical protein
MKLGGRHVRSTWLGTCAGGGTLLAAAAASILFPLQSEGQREQDARLVAMHIWECINIAWAKHETIGEYMTAALIWLESGGTASMARLAQQHRVPRLAALAVNTSGAAWQPARRPPPPRPKR